MLINDPKIQPYNPALDHPLSPRGRFSRLAFLAWYLVISFSIMIPIVLGVAGFFAFSDSVNDLSGILIALAVIAVILYIVFFYYIIVITIRRLHDLNQTGWLCLLMFVPLVSIGLMLYIMFAKGTPANNDFGAPRPNKNWERILGKVYIWLTVLGLVLIIALFASGSLDSINQAFVEQMNADQMSIDQIDETETLDQADEFDVTDETVTVDEADEVDITDETDAVDETVTVDQQATN